MFALARREAFDPLALRYKRSFLSRVLPSAATQGEERDVSGLRGAQTGDRSFPPEGVVEKTRGERIYRHPAFSGMTNKTVPSHKGRLRPVPTAPLSRSAPYGESRNQGFFNSPLRGSGSSLSSVDCIRQIQSSELFQQPPFDVNCPFAAESGAPERNAGNSRSRIRQYVNAGRRASEVAGRRSGRPRIR